VSGVVEVRESALRIDFRIDRLVLTISGLTLG